MSEQDHGARAYGFEHSDVSVARYTLSIDLDTPIIIPVYPASCAHCDTPAFYPFKHCCEAAVLDYLNQLTPAEKRERRAYGWLGVEDLAAYLLNLQAYSESFGR